HRRDEARHQARVLRVLAIGSFPQRGRHGTAVRPAGVHGPQHASHGQRRLPPGQLEVGDHGRRRRSRLGARRSAAGYRPQRSERLRARGLVALVLGVDAGSPEATNEVDLPEALVELGVEPGGGISPGGQCGGARPRRGARVINRLPPAAATRQRQGSDGHGDGSPHVKDVPGASANQTGELRSGAVASSTASPNPSSGFGRAGFGGGGSTGSDRFALSRIPPNATMPAHASASRPWPTGRSNIRIRIRIPASPPARAIAVPSATGSRSLNPRARARRISSTANASNASKSSMKVNAPIVLTINSSAPTPAVRCS